MLKTSFGFAIFYSYPHLKINLHPDLELTFGYDIVCHVHTLAFFIAIFVFQ